MTIASVMSAARGGAGNSFMRLKGLSWNGRASQRVPQAGRDHAAGRGQITVKSDR